MLRFWPSNVKVCNKQTTFTLTYYLCFFFQWKFSKKWTNIYFVTSVKCNTTFNIFFLNCVFFNGSFPKNEPIIILLQVSTVLTQYAYWKFIFHVSHKLQAVFFWQLRITSWWQIVCDKNKTSDGDAHKSQLSWQRLFRNVVYCFLWKKNKFTCGSFQFARS